MKQAQQSQTKTSTGIFNQEQIHHKSQVSYNSSSMISQSSQYSTSTNNGSWDLEISHNFDDLENLSTSSNPLDIEQAILKYSQHVNTCVRHLSTISKAPEAIDKLNEIIRRAWAVRK